jgi:chromosomal replication initiation ATPase DnaA
LTRQLALPFEPRQIFTGLAFLHGAANAEASAWLDNPLSWPSGRLAIHGPPGSGKTHLLHLFAERFAGVLLPGAAIRRWVDLPETGVVAIDDADAAPEEVCLLHVLNAAAERGVKLLLAGAGPPARWPARLPDLVSRLRATHAVALGQPDDALLRALLARLIAARQLRVEEAVQDWLLARLPRSAAAMREAAACLDRISLAAGARVTRGIAAEVLRHMGANDEDFDSHHEQASSGTPALL